MKNSLKKIHNIGNKIRNSGKSIRDKDEMAYKWAIANINSPNTIMKIQAISIIDLYENKYKKNNDNLLEIDYMKKELKKKKPIGDGGGGDDGWCAKKLPFWEDFDKYKQFEEQEKKKQEIVERDKFICSGK